MMPIQEPHVFDAKPLASLNEIALAAAEQGRDAALAGRQAEDNPYRPGSLARRIWEQARLAQRKNTDSHARNG